MVDKWILTPQFFEKPEPVLGEIVPKRAVVNGPHPIPDRSTASMALVHRPIATFTKEALDAGARPISVAGDCCACIPVLAGIRAAGIEPTLVWIDAHADFNTPETSPSQFLGGMPLGMIAGRGPQWMCENVGLEPIAEDRIWLIDGRDLDPLERAAVDGSMMRRTGMAGLETLKIDGPVHLHLDIDVINASEAPGSNYPVAGGPSVAETMSACRAFADANNIIAISISGWTGSLDVEDRTKNACAAILEALSV
jgi:arginase